MEQCEIRQKTELLRQVPGDVSVVEIDAGDDAEVRIFERRGAEDASVAVADVGSGPVSGQIERIREDRLLPSLESNVGGSDSRVFEGERGIDGDVLASVAVLVSVVKKLAAGDEAGLGVGEADAIVGEIWSTRKGGENARESCRDAEEEEEEGNGGFLPHLILLFEEEEERERER